MEFSGTTPPSSQKAGIRPLSFLLDDDGSLGEPIVLGVRPEDLTRTEPARAVVHQTLGRGLTGWVDHFGEGLPSVTISGHTGWRHNEVTGMDGAEAFSRLNQLLSHDFPAAKQAAIDRGSDPSAVKLIFADMLDDFVWSVVPMQFVLRRNKSSPLLYRYNIPLQAVSTSIDAPPISVPFFGNVSSGMAALDRAVATLSGLQPQVGDWVSRALGYVDGVLGPVASTISNFVGMANNVFGMVNGVVRGVKNFVTGVANRFIGMASDVAKVGLNVFRTINNIRNLPTELKARLGRVASAFNEVACIFKNALRPRKTYEEYTGLYGASTCSSTTGGNQASPYANLNAFRQMQPEKDVASANSAALAGLASLKRVDPVLAPMPFPEIGRHMTNVLSGLAL